MKKNILLLVITCITLMSCGNKSEDEIESEASRGVVLVQNKSFYEITLSNDAKMYFTSFDKEEGIKGLVLNKDSVEVATSYGTGFFISKEGEIATNAHVVSNLVADKDVNKSVSELIDALKEVTKELYNKYDEDYQEALKAYNYANYSDDVSFSTFYQIRDYKDALKEKRDEMASTYYNLDDIKPSESEIEYHNEVSIAYNNTFVTNDNDFVSCVITKTDAEHDLAILQLKNKLTPEERYVFTIEEEDPLETYTIMDKVTKTISEDKNNKLYMTGFNLGPALAITKEGVKSQFNNGTISQKTEDRLMYSIPTLPGSSGSPVINRQGQLVAINYAGLNGTQGFNYGIRVKHLKNLLNK